MSPNRKFTGLIVAGFVPTALLLAPATPGRAQQAPAPAPVALVRPGDGAMTCEALAGEINLLAQADASPAAEVAPKPKRHGFGFLKIVGSVMPMAGLVSGAGGALLSSAAGVASTAGGAQSVDQADVARRYVSQALAGPSIAQQRKDRLTAMFENKHC